MVITSPLSNIRGFIATRPPLVLFTLCLIAFAITTFTFAYYVEHRSDLPNIDAHKDWLSFLSYLSNRNLCVVNDEKTVAHDNDTVDLITVTVMATLTSKLNFYNLSIKSVEGYIKTSDWESDCPLSSPVNRVHISYNIPKSLYKNGSDTNIENVCVTITGPKELLSTASDEKKCMHYPDINPHDKWMITSTTDKLETCSKGVSANLKYELNEHNALLLTMDDRRIINLHLFHTSYFLLVMAITLICYAMIKGKPTVKHQPLDKVPIDA